MKKVCVLLSVYKNSKLEYVKECLESIYTQTLKTDIFLKIDGKVNKELEEFLDNEYKKNKIFYLSKREENKGIAVSYNELITEALSRGYTYIARMDSDDIMVKDRIESQYKFMENNPNIDVVGGYIEEFGEDFDYSKIVKYPLNHNDMFKWFAKRVPIANVTSFFRESFFKKAGLYPTSSPTNEDTLIWLNGFLNNCRFANIPKVLVKVRVSKDFFYRRSGMKKAFSDFRDRIRVINYLGYSKIYYFYAFLLFLVSISPPFIKKFMYKYFR